MPRLLRDPELPILLPGAGSDDRRVPASDKALLPFKTIRCFGCDVDTLSFSAGSDDRQVPAPDKALIDSRRPFHTIQLPGLKITAWRCGKI
jgi:hypothetical protein